MGLLEMEEAKKSLGENFDVNDPFSTFVKRIEDTMDISQVAGCPCTIEQIVSKDFNLIIKSQVLPETGMQEDNSQGNVPYFTNRY